jgi:hypothetical protein
MLLNDNSANAQSIEQVDGNRRVEQLKVLERHTA